MTSKERQEMIRKLLRKHQLSVTGSRVKILELFLRSRSALAHQDIEKNTQANFDRVTVYRTLQTFMEKGIVHTIPSSETGVRYGLCKNECEEGHHHDRHVHFICKQCGDTLCLEEVGIPDIPLPKGYSSSQVEVVVSGMCKACK